MPRCTVAIVNWNSWPLLARCLESLSQQTLNDFKVVVVDNASTQPAPDDFFARHPEVTFIRNSTNRGFAAANNQVLNAADTPWIALLNPDAFPAPDWLEKLSHAADRHPEYAAFGSRQLMADQPDALDGDGDVYHVSGLAWRDGHGSKVSACAAAPREIFSPCAAAALYRRDALIAMGGLDEDFFCYFEDVDLGFRLRLAGYRCLLVPDAIAHHVGSATGGGKKSDFAVYHGHRNLVWCYVKNMPGLLFWVLLPLHLCMNLYIIARFACKGRARLILKAKWHALQGIPHIWRKRQPIQAQRVASAGEMWRVMDKRIGRR